MGQTIAEKIFAAHLRDTPAADNMVLDIDVVMCHEITTPIAVMDLVEKGLDRVFDPDKIKAVIDHVTPPKDSKTATQAKIMRDWAKRHGIKDFFEVVFGHRRVQKVPDASSTFNSLEKFHCYLQAINIEDKIPTNHYMLINNRGQHKTTRYNQLV